MKRRNVIAAVALSLIVPTFGCGSREPPNGQSPKTDKAWKPLPADMEGVERVGEDTLRIKPGFKWLKQRDGTLVVQRLASTWEEPTLGPFSCGCAQGAPGQYPCDWYMPDDKTFRCENVRDCLACKWLVR